MLNYELIADRTQTALAPDHWSVVVADVKGSTHAVREGRYRDVNLVGAACIAAVRNAFPARSVPYVFGGDGATFLIEGEKVETLMELLRGVQTMALQNLGLELRIGLLSVGELRKTGDEIRFGFLEYGPGEVLPFFRGTGVGQAEALIKQRFNETVPSHSPESANIQGLSCRLTPFRSLRGRVLSVLVEPRVPAQEEDQVFNQIFKCLKEDGPLERLQPVDKRNLARPWLSSSWKSEARMHRRDQSVLEAMLQGGKALFESILGGIFFRFDLQNSILGRPSVYTKHMLEQSDWIKMDGTLRLVIDVNEREEQKLHNLLENLQRENRIYYGVHASGAAVMTCHFQSVESQKHAHFIDGEGGGLTLASVELKQKRSALKKAG